MAHGDFVWCDLSTFRVEKTKDFYARLFDWRFQPIEQPDGTPYHIASSTQRQCAAIFEMPEKFQRIGLPSFWMSYIQVENVAETVERAASLGGKVEVWPTAFGERAKIALIRDPLGAGFTVYQGDELKPRPVATHPGQMAWNALYVSAAAKVAPFYEALFGWQIDADPAEPGLSRIRSADRRAISEIHELPESLRGRFEFWGVHFSVSDLKSARSLVLELGGQVLFEDLDARAPSILAKDPDGAAFFLVQAKAALEPRSSETGSVMWKTPLALLAVWLAVVLELNWVWGVLFLL